MAIRSTGTLRAAFGLAALAGAGLFLAGCGSFGAGQSDAGIHDAGPIDMEKVEAKRARLDRDGPKRTDMPQEAIDYFMDQRLPEGMTQYPIDRVQAAAEQYRAQRDARLADPTQRGLGLAGEWTEVGPGNIGGRTRAIVVDPTNPSIIYAAGVAGGVFKTIDGGLSWEPTSDNLVNIAVSSLAMDPTNPLVLYAGTGEGFFNGDAVRGLGIFKTVDGGATWQHLLGTTDAFTQQGGFYRVNKIVISPNDPSRVYAATRYGVWRSVDAGATWQLRLANTSFATATNNAGASSAGALDLKIRSDSNPDVLLATFGSFGADGLYRSTNGGTAWSKITDPDINRPDQGRMTIDIAPSNNNIMYICMANNGATAETGRVVDIFRSTDGGTNWEPRLNPGAPFSQLLLTNIPFATGCFGSSNFSQGWYDNIIKIDPIDPDVVWVGGIDLLRSDDGGQNFGLASYWYFDVTDPNYSHADQHEIVFHPQYNGTTNQTMFVGSDGGVSRTDNARAATTTADCPADGDPVGSVTFTSLNNGYGVTQFYHGAISRNSDMFLGGAQDNGTNRTDTRADPNSWFEEFGGDGGYVAIDPRTDLIFYLETQNFGNMRRTDDGGATFTDIDNGLSDSGLFITPFAIDPTNPDTLWTGGQAIWRTTNRGDSWSQKGPNFFGPGSVSAIAVAPGDSNTVYVGYSDGYVAVSRNATNTNPTWNFPSAGLPSEAGSISSLAVYPDDANTVYATCSTFDVPHVYKSEDGGLSWAVIDGIGALSIPNVPAHWLAIRPGDSDELFVGTEVGIFESANGGDTWFPSGFGLPTTVWETIDFQDADTMVAFSHGRGTFINTFGSGPSPCNIADLAEPFNTLDLADIVTFITAFQSLDPSVDFAEPIGTFDLADIVAFVTAFGAGCP